MSQPWIGKVFIEVVMKKFVVFALTTIRYALKLK